MCNADEDSDHADGDIETVRMVEVMTGIHTMTTITLAPTVDLDHLEAFHSSDIEDDADSRVELDAEVGKDDDGDVERDVNQQ